MKLIALAVRFLVLPQERPVSSVPGRYRPRSREKRTLTSRGRRCPLPRGGVGALIKKCDATLISARPGRADISRFRLPSPSRAEAEVAPHRLIGTTAPPRGRGQPSPARICDSRFGKERVGFVFSLRVNGEFASW